MYACGLQGRRACVSHWLCTSRQVGFEAVRQTGSVALPAQGLGPAAARQLQQFMAGFPLAGGFAGQAAASAPPPAAFPGYGQVAFYESCSGCRCWLVL